MRPKTRNGDSKGVAPLWQGSKGVSPFSINLSPKGYLKPHFRGFGGLPQKWLSTGSRSFAFGSEWQKKSLIVLMTIKNQGGQV